MKITILAFGIAKDILGNNTLSLDIDDQMTVGDIKQYLCDHYPAFKQLAALSLAVNTEYAEDEQYIRQGDEVVIIPPVSGG
jgi:molybdopterin converting factor subunit 1